ncbi:MAG: site-2 protease family protein [bacterium]|nr:site-2 protease family protein [bacterium]
MFSILAAPEGLSLLTSILAIGIAVVFHEVSHGYVANWLGDPTAKYAGRLSLNPIKHIDLWGTIIIPGILLITQAGVLFGWAKPVPVNYYNLKYGKYGPLLVALAGPAANFLILIICGALFRISSPNTALPYLFLIIGLTNTFLMLFNLLPIPPLDGSKILFIFLEKRPDIIAMLERYGMFVVFGVIIFFPGFLTNAVFLPAITLTSIMMGVSVSELINLL